jgi:hypothetical protein
MSIRRSCVAIVLFALFAADAAEAAAACPGISATQHQINRLRPGPNTRAAQRHLDAARRARSDAACRRELLQADRYARRSAAADRRAAARRSSARPSR